MTYLVRLANDNRVSTSEQVPAIVANAHGDIDFVRAALAAGHMGRRDIAELLLEHGARLDLFVAAMLGELEIVEAMLATHPGMRDAKGPHGISLLKHAEAGGDPAQAVVDLLRR